MTFHDPKTIKRRVALAGERTTFEIGRDGWQRGHTVRLDVKLTPAALRVLMSDVFDEAGAHHCPRVAAPGWWAIVIGSVADRYGPASISRMDYAAERHVCVLVGDDRMGRRPDWPMVRFAPTMPWLDLRTEAALRHGPSDTELEMYRHEHDLHDVSIGDLAHQFDIGVLEWIPGEAVGRRRGIRAAGS